jgi:hypothetical protein
MSQTDFPWPDLGYRMAVYRLVDRKSGCFMVTGCFLLTGNACSGAVKFVDL